MLPSSNSTRVASAFSSIRRRSGCRRATSSTRSRVPVRGVIAGGQRHVPRARRRSSRTTRQSFGSRLALEEPPQPVPAVAARRGSAAATRTLASPCAAPDRGRRGRMTAFSVWSQPAQPWRVGLMPSFGEPALDGPVPAVLEPLEVRAHALGAPGGIAGELRDARSSPRCADTTKIIALCAVQPPSGRRARVQTPSTGRPSQVSRYFGSRRCCASSS